MSSNIVNMLTEHRKQQILAVLKKNGQVIAKDISQAMNLSEDTIRRDLRELAQEGLLQRVHGGALPVSPAIANFAAREQIGHEGKVAIGKAAANMIRSGQVVFLDGGTTAREIARNIPVDMKAKVVTHSPTIALELVAHPSIEVILIGGRLFKHSVVSVGASCIEAISQIKADSFFMGVTGVHPQAGLTTGDYEEAAVKRALSRAAAETFVLASAEKLNTASPFQVVGLDEVSAIITEKEAESSLIRSLEETGVKVIQV